MYIDWTKHLTDPEEKSRFTAQVENSRPVLRRLQQILAEKELTLDRVEMNIGVYNTDNWAYRQAHKNGNREMLWFLNKLVDLDQQTAHRELS